MTMERAVRIAEQGGPEVIQWVDVELPAPGPGEVRMRNTAVGLNFIDTYHRGGVYKMAMPSGLGVEAAGAVEAIGDGVTNYKIGDRVCTFGLAVGAYATARNIPANMLFHVPDDISDEIAAAAAGLPLELESDDSVYDYEKAHLPATAWPPTSWYAGWVSGQDVFDVPREASPIELRWLGYRKTA